MKTSVCRRLSLLIGMVTPVVFLACDAATAVSTATSPTLSTKCQAVLAASSSIAAVGGSGNVSITTQPECLWDASSEAGWITGLTPTSGQGNGQVEFRVTPNPDPAVREGNIQINDARLRVVQDAAPCIFEVRPGGLAIGAAGGSISVSVSAHDRCRWTAASQASWLTVASPTTGTGSGSLTFGAARNSGGVRTGNIAVAEQTFAVTQDGAGGPVAAPGPRNGDDDRDNDGDDEDNDDDDGGNSGKGKGKEKDKDKGKDDSVA
jgi:hypothetical protein